ncbi:segregation/condensation protein A [Streptomyces sp. NPDC012769]|uniref:segregation/condensation protein A n=1 Tax=Streptomyces sp. NPDC012769 TaxID=3364848 RepID=UPI0036BD03EF
MPPPPDETSRPPRRRALGRGPGASPSPASPTAGERPEPREPHGPVPAPSAGARASAASKAGAERVDGPGGSEGPDGPEGPRERLEAARAATEAGAGPDADRDGSEGLEGQYEAGEAPHAEQQDGLPAGPRHDAEPVAVPDRALQLDSVSEVVPGRAQQDFVSEVVPGRAQQDSVPDSVLDGPRLEAVPSALPEAVGSGGASGEPGGPTAPATGAPAPPVGADGRFTVRLANFEGPFDLLLQLIAKHKMDVTEVALSKVTDEFMAHIRAMGPDWDLDQTTEFLVVAATLLDLKAARLLPAAEVEDEADLALLEARDLLFARLLQYRAYKKIAEIFAERWEAEGRRHPRTVGLEPHHAELLPEVVISIGAEGFAKLAVKAMQPKARPQVYVDHIHAPLVSVREQAAVVVALLRERGTLSFRELVEGADDTLTVVARFLALLELYREKAVALDQETALGDLTVSWTGGETDAAATAVTDEFDQEAPQEDAR